MSAITPQKYKKRSFIYHKLTAKEYIEISDSAFVVHSAHDQIGNSGLSDLSNVLRTGFRGLNAADHLSSVGLPIPEKPNRVEVSANGELVLRLSQKEFWVLANPNAQSIGHTSIDKILAAKAPKQQCFSLYCQDSHAWMLLSGKHLSKIMAKLCAVDLSVEAFPVGHIAQTSAARVNVIVVHHQFNEQPCFSLLCDSAAAEYLWDCLLDAMQEFDGKEIGLFAINDLSRD